MTVLKDKVIITCAVTGAIHTPTMSPYLPITPEEIATASIEAAEAGASIIHLHARDPETGKPDPRPELFQDFMARIAAGTDAVMNVSTGGGLGMTREERLRAASDVSACSKNGSSLMTAERLAGQDTIHILPRRAILFDRDGDDEYKGGTKHGPSHATKAFPGAIGTVHAKRLIKILRDRLQPCHEKDHRKAKILPDANRNEGEKRRIRILQPISGGQAQGPEKLIDETNGRVEHEFPDQRHGEQR